MRLNLELDTETSLALWEAACEDNTTPCAEARELLRTALREKIGEKKAGGDRMLVKVQKQDGMTAIINTDKIEYAVETPDGWEIVMEDGYTASCGKVEGLWEAICATK